MIIRERTKEEIKELSNIDLVAIFRKYAGLFDYNISTSDESLTNSEKDIVEDQFLKLQAELLKRMK